MVRNTIVDTTRWAIVHELVFRHEDKLYSTTYRTGATEYQEEQPWEHEKTVDCTEVEQFECTVTDYRAIP